MDCFVLKFVFLTGFDSSSCTEAADILENLGVYVKVHHIGP